MSHFTSIRPTRWAIDTLAMFSSVFLFCFVFLQRSSLTQARTLCLVATFKLCLNQDHYDCSVICSSAFSTSIFHVLLKAWPWNCFELICIGWKAVLNILVILMFSLFIMHTTHFCLLSMPSMRRFHTFTVCSAVKEI